VATKQQRTFFRRLRAEGRLTAYRTALDYVQRLSHDDIVRRLTEKIEHAEQFLEETT